MSLPSELSAAIEQTRTGFVPVRACTSQNFSLFIFAFLKRCLAAKLEIE